MIIIYMEKEKKYILKEDKIKILLDKERVLKSEGIIQWYIDPEDGYDETRIRLVEQKTASGISKRWVKTSKKKLVCKDEREEKEEIIEIGEAERQKIMGARSVCKIRHYLCRDPEIVVDEFLTPYGKKYNNFDYKYVMEVELKKVEKSFDEILLGNNLNDYIKEEVTGGISNKDIAVQANDFIKEIKYVENRLEGTVTVFFSPGKSIMKVINSKESDKVKKYLENVSILKGLSKESIGGVCAEVDTIDLLEESGFEVSKVVMFLVKKFLENVERDILNDLLPGLEILNKEKYPNVTDSSVYIYYILKNILKIESIEIEFFEEESTKSENQKALQEKLWEVLDKYDRQQKVIMDIAPGLKNISIMQVIYSLFKKKSFYYKFEHSQELLEFPAFGFDWDYAYLDEIIHVIESKKLETKMSTEDYLKLPDMITKVYQLNQSKDFEPFYSIDRIGRMYKSKKEVPFGYGENLINFVNNSDLESYLTQGIKKKWTNMWIGDLIPETVEHSQRHSKRLMDFTVKLINVMGEEEFLGEVPEGEYYNGMSYKTIFYFLLIAAMNVHDLGHTYAYFYFDGEYGNEKKRLILDKYPNFVRDLHNELTISLIREEKLFDILGKGSSFSSESKKVTDLFGEKTDEIIEALILICRYHREHLGIDEDIAVDKKKDICNLFRLDTSPLKKVIKGKIGDEKLSQVVIHAARWLKFIDGTDVQADRIITPQYNIIRKKRTAYEALFLIEKHLLKYESAEYKDELIRLKELLEKEEFLEVKEIKSRLEKMLLEEVNPIIQDMNFLKFYDPRYEELAHIIFKVSQFEHFEKHNAVGAIYPVAFTCNGQAQLVIEIIPNISEQKDAENVESEIKRIYEDIEEELEKAEIKVRGMKLKLGGKKHNEYIRRISKS